ncbi:MAG: GAF and ANTAR domain-containing protein [Nitriliruptoraceae bacterium]
MSITPPQDDSKSEQDPSLSLPQPFVAPLLMEEHVISDPIDKLQRRDRELLEAFVELADTLVEDFDLVEFLSGLAERVVALEIASEVGILLTDKTGKLQFVAASHERTQMLELFQIEHQEGPCQDCFKTGKPVRVDELADEAERWPVFGPKAVMTGFRSIQAVPLRLRGNILGAMNLFFSTPNGVSAESLSVIQAMADVATIGILQQRELHRAHTVEAQLQHALQSRISIEQAKGVISEQAKISPDSAFFLLRSYARDNNRKLADIADTVVQGKLSASDLMTKSKIVY